MSQVGIPRPACPQPPSFTSDRAGGGRRRLHDCGAGRDPHRRAPEPVRGGEPLPSIGLPLAPLPPRPLKAGAQGSAASPTSPDDGRLQTEARREQGGKRPYLSTPSPEEEEESAGEFKGPSDRAGQEVTSRKGAWRRARRHVVRSQAPPPRRVRPPRWAPPFCTSGTAPPSRGRARPAVTSDAVAGRLPTVCDRPRRGEGQRSDRVRVPRRPVGAAPSPGAVRAPARVPWVRPGGSVRAGRAPRGPGLTTSRSGGARRASRPGGTRRRPRRRSSVRIRTQLHARPASRADPGGNREALWEEGAPGPCCDLFLCDL